MSLRAGGDPAPLHELSAVEAARRMAAGELSAVDYARALLERVDAVETAVQAWAHLDRAGLLAQAGQADARRRAGEPLGPLAGVPVGVKDIIDTAGMPTEHGTSLYAGRVPQADAAVVAALRQAGGLLMGKTVTTELATYAPGKTRHPQHPGHTPGGSSSGSAAAVAAGMVPLAIGTQTNGSMIRPAAFCGVVGYKPSFGLLSRRGVLSQSPPLDQLGVFGRSVEDVALLTEVLCAARGDHAGATPALRSTAAAAPPRLPRLGFVRTPFWPQMDTDAQAAFEAFAQALGAQAEALALPIDAPAAVQTLRLIMEADIARSFAGEYARGRDQLSASLRGQIERGRQTPAAAYDAALAGIPALRDALAPLFERFDALVTPATLGTAPAGLDSTGDPLMCTVWTLTGLPAISLPLLRGANGLPLGVQLVGGFGADAALLRTARALMQRPAP